VRRVALSVLVSLAAIAVTSAQRADDQAQQPPSFRSTARLVPISVVVHDKRGNPVPGLTASDFRIVENGKEQPIALFSVESAATTTAAARVPNTFTNRIDGPAAAGVTVILYDRLNTRDVHQQQAREHLITFLKQIRPSDRVGLYVLESDSVRVLHDFTQDAASLLKAIDRAASGTSSALAGSQDKLPAGATDALDAELASFLRGSELAMQSFFFEQRARASAGALEGIAAHLAGIRGRKSVIWVSSGFPIMFDDGMIPRNMSAEVYRATRALSHSDVAIYPVDARGLMGAFATEPSARVQEFATIDTIMRDNDASQIIAEQTGGRAFFNTNDLGRAIIRAVEDTNLTYMLGYYPQNDKWDGRFRDIKVSVQRRDVDVRHRRGYFAHPPVLQDAEAAKNAVLGALKSPLDATGLPLTIRVEPGSQVGELRLSIQLEPGALALAQKTVDAWEGSVQLAIAHAMPSGEVVTSVERTLHVPLTSAERDRQLTQGLTFSQTVPMREGAHQLRVVVRDVLTGQIGSIAIPMSEVRKAGSSTSQRSQ
jgi:VWFA-related protein